MIRKLVVLAAALAVSAISAGCGGGGGSSSSSSGASGGVPVPKQTVSQYVARFAKVASSRDCAGFKALGFSDPCARLVRLYGSAKPKGTATFRTGALVDLDNGWTLILELNTHRQWTTALGAQLKHPTVGTTTTDAAGARAAADGTFRSIVHKDCAAFYRYAYTPGIFPAQKERICKPAFANLGPVYSQNPRAKPIALGGTRDVQFYGYFLKDRTRRYYATVAVVFSKSSNTSPWLTLAPSPVLLSKG